MNETFHERPPIGKNDWACLQFVDDSFASRVKNFATSVLLSGDNLYHCFPILVGPSYSCDEVQASLVLETREMMRILKIVTPRGAPTRRDSSLPSSRGNVSCVYMKIGMLKLLSLVHPYGKPSGGPSTRTRTRLRNFRADRLTWEKIWKKKEETHCPLRFLKDPPLLGLRSERLLLGSTVLFIFLWILLIQSLLFEFLKLFLRSGSSIPSAVVASPAVPSSLDGDFSSLLQRLDDSTRAPSTPKLPDQVPSPSDVAIRLRRILDLPFRRSEGLGTRIFELAQLTRVLLFTALWLRSHPTHWYCSRGKKSFSWPWRSVCATR